MWGNCDLFGWNWMFGMILVVGVASVIVAVDRSTDENRERLDPLGLGS
jgi:predicted MFS family arabinose efflux permease